ncbi:hypothetical protein J2X02_003830 [Pseudoxanthomonas japonensis]|uniref:hypothetical protein n=1 Tax=Pseudoxanthomonas japonensis TaxID=69284 RepID=UPI00285E9C2C|nr:hypothetical protein [Pseudoxanthomonas japonensis]MDR7070956.1 hypothetical protein [Pseudoxanthomonas japonensis]
MSTTATSPSFSDVAEFVRDFAGFGHGKAITAQTRLDADLGIAGLDGDDLLKQAAEHFNAKLAGSDGYISTFNLAPNEYLFGSEGLDLLGIGALVRPRPLVRDLTAGELHDAICRYRLAPIGAA